LYDAGKSRSNAIMPFMQTGCWHPNHHVSLSLPPLQTSPLNPSPNALWISPLLGWVRSLASSSSQTKNCYNSEYD